MIDYEQKIKSILRSPHMSILSEYTKISCPNCKGIVKYVLSLGDGRKKEPFRGYLSKCPFCDRCYFLEFEGLRKTKKKTVIPIEQTGLAEKIQGCFDVLRSSRKIQRNKEKNLPQEYMGSESWSPYREGKEPEGYQKYV